MAVEPNSVGDRENKTGVKHTALLDRNTPRDFGSDSITKSGKNSKSKPKFKSPISNESPQSPASTAAAAAAKAQLDKQKRRKHKNSKLGCPNCKQRRVKCSEDLPSCLNCIKHKVECGYLKYTKEELEELKQAKLDRLQSLNYSDTKSESEETEQQMGLGSRKGSPLSGSSTDPPINKRKKSSTQSKVQKPGSKRSSAKTSSQRISQFQNQKIDDVSATTTAANTSSTDTQEEVRGALVNSNTRGNGRVVIQNFDDLLGHDSGSGNSIVYPVYRMHQNDPEPHLTDNQNQDSGKSSGSLSHLPTTPASLLSANALPGAILRPTSFSVSRFWRHGNYAKEHEQLIVRSNSEIVQGETKLEQMRLVYLSWLRSLVYLGTFHPLRFYSLLNICANYLISSCFEDSYKFFSCGTSSPAERGKELAYMRQTCLAKTIRYYDEVIKRLRSMLASSNPDPDTTCSVSYFLGLTSIYDPERSSYSTNCYREGLLGMLEYFNSLSAPRGPPLSVKIELKLVTNILMAGNLPAYDPILLTDAREVLIAYGDILFHVCERVAGALPSDDKRVQTSQFLQLKYHQLLQFLNEAIDIYFPQINANINNVEVQQDLLYQMLIKWLIIYPSRLLFPTVSQGPFELLMYLFYKFVKKALFAIFPHVKFFFLRNFDGPVLLDVYAIDDYTVYEQLSQPQMWRADKSNYEPHMDKLKYIAAFLIRGSTYMRKRFAILYPILMRFVALHDFQGTDINKWRKTVQNFATLRKDFCEKMQVSEVNLKSLINGYIKRNNYPITGKVLEDRSLSHVQAADFTTLLPSGLLAGDYDPALENSLKSGI